MFHEIREKIKSIFTKLISIIKKTTRKLKNVSNNAISNLKSYAHEQFNSTDKPVYYFLLLIIGAWAGCMLLNVGIPKWIAFIAGAVITILIFMLIIKFSTFLLQFIQRYIQFKGIKAVLVMVLLFCCISYFIMFGCMGIVPSGIGIAVSVLLFLVTLLFIKSLYAIVFNKKNKPSLFIICIVSGLLFGTSMYLFVEEGFEDTYIKEYVKLYEQNAANQKEKLAQAKPSETIKTNKQIQDLAAEMERGAHVVGIIDYGMEQKRINSENHQDENSDINSSDTVLKIESTSFNMTPYVSGYEGIEAAYRTWYQGYDIKNVPLAGRIWYPQSQEECPVLFIIHGNHNFTTESYLGYEYLGEYLASHGYVVVSVDQNFCNGNLLGNLTEENDARAVLLLENIKQILIFNKTEENPLYHKIDEQSIAIAGHSRGGEAVATAAYFNKLENYPENGTIDFNYDFNIKSVIAIAPTADQYKPVDRSVTLEDVNYLLVHGANDQDVSDFMGLKQYNNLDFTGEDDYFKSYLYIAGANHGQFNTEWGKYDVSLPFNKVYNVENLLSKEQQEQVLEIFTKKFLDVTLLDQKEQKDLFYNVQKYQSQLPETVYIQGYADSSYEYVCDFEEDLDLTTTTMEGGSINTYGMSKWTEKLSRFSDGSNSPNKGDYTLSVEWKKTKSANVTVQLPSYNANSKIFSFEIQDVYNADVKDEKYNLLNAEIILEDSHSRQAKAFVKDYYSIYPPLPVKLSKLQYIFGENEYKQQLQTVRIPVSEFEAEEGFDETDIVKIKFLFSDDYRGNVRIDDIAFASDK